MADASSSPQNDFIENIEDKTQFNKVKKLSKHDIAEPSKIDEEEHDVQELLFEKRRLKQMMI